MRWGIQCCLGCWLLFLQPRGSIAVKMKEWLCREMAFLIGLMVVHIFISAIMGHRFFDEITVDFLIQVRVTFSGKATGF